MSTTYLFTVTGGQIHQIIEWDCGDIDPGKEYLRVATGGLYGFNTVSDYNPDMDAALPRVVFAYENGVLQGLEAIPAAVITTAFGAANHAGGAASDGAKAISNAAQQLGHTAGGVVQQAGDAAGTVVKQAGDVVSDGLKQAAKALPQIPLPPLPQIPPINIHNPFHW